MKLTSLFCLLVCVFASQLQAESSANAEVPKSVLKRYDKNKDGQLDEKETAKWQADLAKRREKAQAARQALLERYDINKDGKLSEEEKATAKLEMATERTERELAKGKEKAEERMAEEKAAEPKAKDETTSPSPTPPPPASSEEMTTGKPDESTMGEDGMMME
jgi:septal ring factor EnvC (AmiA/AmiB activator)